MPLNRAYSREDKAEVSLVRSLWGSIKRKPSQSYPHYIKTSDVKNLISSPLPIERQLYPSLQNYCPSSLIDLIGASQSSPCPTKAHPTIPTRTTSFSFGAKRKTSTGSGLYALRSFSSVQLNSFTAKLSVSSPRFSTGDSLDFPIPPPRSEPPRTPKAESVTSDPSSPSTPTKRGGNSLYALKSFSTNNLLSLGAKPSSTASASSVDLSSSPSPTSLRRSRFSARARSVPAAGWVPPRKSSCIPEHPPQIAALELFGSFTFPLISQLDGSPTGIPGVIMEVPAEEEEGVSPLMPLSAALDLDALPIPSPPLPSSLSSTSSNGQRSSPRHSITPSCSSGSSTDDSTLYSFPFSGSSISGCPISTGEAGDVPLSPWRIPSGERRKGSVVFPSRLSASASCISLGRY